MRSASSIVLLLSWACLAACGGPVSSRVVREQIASLGGAGLDTDAVEVRRIIAEAGNRAVAEATVQMAFEFERDAEGEWRIIAVRLGEEDWVDLATFEAALSAQQVEETRSSLRMLADGVAAYARQNGTLPEVSLADPLPDLLHPLFVPDLVRQDAWGSDFVYEPAADTFRLRSPGPDRQLGTPDDLEVTAPQGR